jgi:hypothetical protein
VVFVVPLVAGLPLGLFTATLAKGDLAPDALAPGVADLARRTPGGVNRGHAVHRLVTAGVFFP